MVDFELHAKTAGAYVLYDGYFLFMFGFGSNHKDNELGVVRFGGYREKGETSIQCAAREVKEESLTPQRRH
jgi:8-oxo-dGTP pyrophosphatase MutT (NUDIX family)